MNVKDAWHETKCFGSTVVSPRGQVVIPAAARKELDINTGATLLVFKLPHNPGLVLLKADAIEQMLSMMNEQENRFERLAKDHKSQSSREKREE